MSVRNVLFIDANQYLDLYAIPRMKKIVPALQEQRDHILVTTQVVDEVNRNKVKKTAIFLAGQLKNLELNSIAVPAHLLSDADDRVAAMVGRLEQTRRKVEEAKKEFKKLTHDVLEQVSQSRDEMSRASLTFLSGRSRLTTVNQNVRGRERNAAIRQASETTLLNKP